MNNENNETKQQLNNKSSVTSQTNKPLTKQDKFKRIFFQILIACLIGAAAIAVVAVLVGSFSETLSRALGTIATVAIHASLSFSYISETEKRNKKDGGRSIELFSNAVFTLIVISFITSVFAIWQILSGELTSRLYLSYGVLLFATLHADILFRIRKFENKIDTVINVNYAVMAIVVAMLFFVIYASDPSNLGALYYRILAAFGIVDATMTMTAIIMHRLYLQKHPEEVPQNAAENSAQSKSFLKNPLVVLLLLYLAFQVLGSLLALIFSATQK